MAVTPGRNDPCPCGSGRKFKHCCLQRQNAADAARFRIRSLEGRVVDSVGKYALERWGEPLFHHAWEDFWGYDDVPEDIVATPEFGAMFIPWLTTCFVADPEAEGRTDDWPTATLATEWLSVQPGPVDPALHAYVTQAARSPMSVFAVEAVVPGASVDVKDILTGRRFQALETAASRSLHAGDVVFTRVVTLDGISVMFGLAPYAAPAAWHVRILDWRDAVVRRRPRTRATLESFEIEIRDLYFLVRQAVLNPVPPTLRNTDGDRLSLITLTYELHVAVPFVYPLLVPLATLAGEVHDEDVERDADGRVVKVELHWIKASRRKDAREEVTVLGTLRLEPGRLVAEVNSEKRAARLQREIVKRLGKVATLLERQVVDPVQDFVQQRATLQKRKGLRLVEPVPASADLEIAALEATLRRRHSEEWLDMEVPALGGKTPRQAARSVAGRERLEALLLTFGRQGDAGADEEVAFLRKALKLPQPPGQL